MIRTENLTKSFGGLTAVNNVSIEFPEGKITSIIGPNGAGKTTLFNLVTGFIKPDSGKIFFGEKRIDNLKNYQISRIGIGRLYQDARVFKKLSLIDNVILGNWNIFGEKPHQPFFYFRKTKEENLINIKKAIDILRFVNLDDKKNKMAEDISFGEQKLLSFARLLFGGYKVLLLDEPTAGVNPQIINRMIELIRKLVIEEKKTIVIIEHNMNFVHEISEWIYFMNEGEIIAFGRPDDVLGNKEVRKIYIGL